MSGTNLAYGASCLRAQFVLSGTDLAYCATRHGLPSTASRAGHLLRREIKAKNTIPAVQSAPALPFFSARDFKLPPTAAAYPGARLHGDPSPWYYAPLPAYAPATRSPVLT
eukprot:3941628-Rhodomonas_salina.3